ncbi:hypothetical protein M413DRAFT_123346 [Hebeloma cylindrosporum]|uniref:Uncharacterized protein n=1 Tax=Hebeloma cylindrosporum TaxID=76867 RepID=A0A0C2XYR4_HEBCY|nr:hypothetical protein M413DRAFT_123346 [Hebeloma cylindrosporum h7]
MDHSTPPPAYNSPTPGQQVDVNNTEALPPPNYTPPSKFTIGSSTTEPLVRIVEVKGHLALLHAFSELKNQVDALEVPVPHVPADNEKKWAWFVALAVEQFDVWCQGLKPGDKSKSMKVVLPPIDVLMVWHAYMLNPRWYAEDCMRIPACGLLKEFERHFGALLEDPTSPFLTETPTQARQDFWFSRTSLPFDPFEGMKTMTNKIIFCPKCNGPISVELMNALGTGYFQQRFTSTCTKPTCTFGEVTKEKLAMRKLASDIAKKAESDHVDASSHLAGSFFTSNALDGGKVNKNKQNACELAKPFYVNSPLNTYVYGSLEYREQLCLAVMNSGGNTLLGVRGRLRFSTQPRLIGRVMSAYNDDKAYSAELVGAVLRQGSFVQKMYDLGWTHAGYFDKAGDGLALQHAMARYHAFLDLMSSSPASFFVPTLDIDLVWHTHQLFPQKYSSDCEQYLRRFIDHDDKVEGVRLSSAFDITCRAWKERFGVQYTHCGCPIPGDTIGQRLSRIVGIYSPPTSPPSHLMPFERPDLLSATHPSDHNAVRFMAQTERAHKLMTMKYENVAKKKVKEREKAAKKAAKAAMEAKARGSAIRSSGAGHQHGYYADGFYDPYYAQSVGPDGRRSRSSYAHTAVFLLPVPIFFGAGMYAYGGGVGGCVSADGGMVDSRGGCGSVRLIYLFYSPFDFRPTHFRSV